MTFWLLRKVDKKSKSSVWFFSFFRGVSLRIFIGQIFQSNHCSIYQVTETRLSFKNSPAIVCAPHDWVWNFSWGNTITHGLSTKSAIFRPMRFSFETFFIAISISRCRSRRTRCLGHNLWPNKLCCTRRCDIYQIKYIRG